jgi:hypothetical protein
MPFRHHRSDQFFSLGQEELPAPEIQRRQLARFDETANVFARIVLEHPTRTGFIATSGGFLRPHCLGSGV